MMNQEPNFGVLRRLVGSNGETKYKGEYTCAEDLREVAIDLGEVTTDLWSLLLPPCPDCGDGEIVWAEAGYVPGARACTKCGSMFSLDTWSREERLTAIASDWRRKRNRCRDDDLAKVDPEYARRIGLPVLAALADLLDRVERASGPIGPTELSMELRPILALARGEAQRRAERLGINLEIPGIVAIPAGQVL